MNLNCYHSPFKKYLNVISSQRKYEQILKEKMAYGILNIN